MKLSEFLAEIGRPVAYYPSLAKMLGSVKASIMLCQLSYWNGRQTDNENWIFKTIEEMYEETGLSRNEQDNAIKALKSKGILEVKVKGLPARRYFQINQDKLEEIWKNWLTEKKTQDCCIPANKFAENQQTGLMDSNKPVCDIPPNNINNSIYINKVNKTEITAETTTEITTETTVYNKDNRYIDSKCNMDSWKGGMGGNQQTFYKNSDGDDELNNHPEMTDCDYGQSTLTGLCNASEANKSKPKKKRRAKNEEANKAATKKIFDTWNNKGIPVCHTKLTDRMASAINARLSDGYCVEDICKAINNYAEIVQSEEHFWNYSGWDLITFLNPKNLDRFLDANEPQEVFRRTGKHGKDGKNKQKKKDSPSRYGIVDLADFTDDPDREPRKIPIRRIANDDIVEAFYAWKRGELEQWKQSRK
jgi:hypothetical protein